MYMYIHVSLMAALVVQGSGQCPIGRRVLYMLYVLCIFL